MTDIYKGEAVDPKMLDPDSTIAHWRSLEGREKSHKEINDERLAAWRHKYDAYTSLENWRKYQQHSKKTGT